jgi:hypothetical protein
MSEAWATHVVCIPCYDNLNPEIGTLDLSLLIVQPEMCCHCGHFTNSVVAIGAPFDGMPHCTAPGARELGARG